MTALFTNADGLLRPTTRLTLSGRTLVAMLIVFGAFYGALMGLYYDPDGSPRPLQSFYSATKVPILLLVTFGLALPSFYVLNMLLGLAGDFREVLQALLATQAGLTVVLASLSPFTLLFYASTTDYNSAILFNAVMFAAASFAGQRLLMRFYTPLIARDARHRKMVRLWIVVYAFVGIQMGWVLRPFIGDPGKATVYFREGAWGNAYIEVWDKVLTTTGLGVRGR